MNRPYLRTIAKLLTGPLMIIPQALLVGMFVGRIIDYQPPELHGDLERHLFLQGNTDWGGGSLFAGTIALYVVFGFTAAWYLTLSLADEKTGSGFWRTVLRSFGILIFHIIAFVIGGTIHIIGYDGRVMPNDFRNMFLFAAMIYTLSIFLIAALRTTRLPLGLRLALAPLFIVAWLIVGSDGNTARAGQLVQSGQDPQHIVRGKRHAVMLTWHSLCDTTLGDIKDKTCDEHQEQKEKNQQGVL